MFLNRKVLAVVPARSGSKGIPDKNIRHLGGVSLIGWAGRCLQSLQWIDDKVISTDDAGYAAEAKKYGLDAPFLRPPELSSDTVSAIDTMVHAIKSCEVHYEKQYDVVLIIEPTSPFRRPEDVTGACRALIERQCDSVITVTPANTTSHPLKMLRIDGGLLKHYLEAGENITRRQQLDKVFFRNGICYALTRDCLLNKKAIITAHSLPFVVERHIVNIDDPTDFLWAEFLLERHIVQ